MEKRIILVGISTFVLSVIILILIKPAFIMKVNKDFKNKIDWYKTVFLSIILSVLICVCVFLYYPKEDIIEYNNFGFGISY